MLDLDNPLTRVPYVEIRQHMISGTVSVKVRFRPGL